MPYLIPFYWSWEAQNSFWNRYCMSGRPSPAFGESWCLAYFFSLPPARWVGKLHSVDHLYRTYCNWFGIYRPQTQSWVCKTPTRHLPDTFQTPYRHPKIWHVLTNPRQLGEKEDGIIDESNWMVINCLHIISPQAVSRVTQTTPRRLPDTFQTTYRHPNYGTFLPIQGN